MKFPKVAMGWVT